MQRPLPEVALQQQQAIQMLTTTTALSPLSSTSVLMNADADQQLSSLRSPSFWGEPVDDDDSTSNSEVCNVSMEDFSVTINDDLTLDLWQAPTAFRGVEHDETGSVVWGASICLSRFLSPESVQNQRVLELGCGCGLPSMVAAKYGAAQVVATDREDKTLQHLDRLAQRNGLVGNSLELYKLNWKESDVNYSLEDFQADIILASDVIYSRDMVDPLVAAIDKYLDANGKAYLALRNTREGVTDFWQQSMPGAGLTLVERISCQPYLQDNGSEPSNTLPPGFQNEAISYRWRGDHTIYVFQRNEI